MNAPLSHPDLCAVLSVADHLVGRAGRTTLALALRGSRAARVLRHGVADAPGYGHFAGTPPDAVLAHIDALIAGGVLRLAFHDGVPLLAYTETGLQLAMRHAAAEWLAALQSRVPAVAAGAALELPPALATIQERNQNTVLLLTDLVGRIADAAWLSLLRAWSARETRRVRGRLAPIIAALERTAPGANRPHGSASPLRRAPAPPEAPA